MDFKVICVVFALAVSVTFAGPVVDDAKGTINNSVSHTITFFFIIIVFKLNYSRFTRMSLQLKKV